MNYRHAFHAGGIADVFKHAVLIHLLERLAVRDKPFFVLDTHAGIGRYALDGAEAQRTGEYHHGIDKVMGAASPGPLLHRLAELARAEGAARYPGSPLIASALRRPGDRLALCELHAEDVELLRAACRGLRDVAIHHRDGWEALPALLPPAERRGLVLIDPPFEQPEELRRAVDGLASAWQRWSTGQFMLWYPIKERSTIDRFHAALQSTAMRKTVVVEFLPQAEDQRVGLNGSGLILVNPPWQIEEAMAQLFVDLKASLDLPDARTRTIWLIGE